MLSKTSFVVFTDCAFSFKFYKAYNTVVNFSFCINFNDSNFCDSTSLEKFLNKMYLLSSHYLKKILLIE